MLLLDEPAAGVPEDERHEADDQQDPRDDLVPGERVVEPDGDVEQDERDDELPGEEAIEAMRARRTERGPRDIDDGDGEYDEGDYLDRGVLSNLCLLSLRSPWSRASVIAFTWTDHRGSA